MLDEVKDVTMTGEEILKLLTADGYNADDLRKMSDARKDAVARGIKARGPGCVAVAKRVAIVDFLNGMPDEDSGTGHSPHKLHEQADEMVCDLLRCLGYGEVADAFEDAKNRVPFWYA